MSIEHPVFGPLIHAYTRADALADGSLVDVTTVAREAGFTVPVAVTRAVWLDCVAWADDGGACQDEAGRLWDVLWMARFAARRARSSYSRCAAPAITGSPS